MFRKYATILVLTLFSLACATTADDPNRKTKRGATIGAIAGAVVGGVIGNQSGNERTGAVVGAAAGAAVGAAIGRQMDKQEAELRQIEGVEVTRPSEGEIQLGLKSDILFDYDSAALRPESRAVLRELAQNFRQYPGNILIVSGHTDSTGSEAYNQRLSERRAASVADYLIEQGVSASSITVYGFGELRPKAPNDTPEGRQLNRRVEINIRAAQS